jgi:hypothetical protein
MRPGIVREEDIVFQPHGKAHNFSDITGKVFERLTVIGFAGNRNGRSYWYCRCECKQVCEIQTSQLRCRKAQSCGCLNSERSKRRRTTHGARSDGQVHYLYSTYRGILARCRKPLSTSYKNYGARGITVAEQWGESFERFRDDVLAEIGERPAGTSLDRIKNDKGYEPGNIRWATRPQQARNTRRSRLLTINGCTKCLIDWLKEPGARTRWIVTDRLNKGVEPSKAVFGKADISGRIFAVPHVASSE